MDVNLTSKFGRLLLSIVMTSVLCTACTDSNIVPPPPAASTPAPPPAPPAPPPASPPAPAPSLVPPPVPTPAPINCGGNDGAFNRYRNISSLQLGDCAVSPSTPTATQAPIVLQTAAPLTQCLLPDPADPQPVFGSNLSANEQIRHAQDFSGFCRHILNNIKTLSQFFYPVVFNSDHYGPRIQQKIRSPLANLEQAILTDLQARAALDETFPRNIEGNPQKYNIIFNDMGTPVVVQYRVALIVGSSFLPDAYLSVGTIIVNP